MSHRCQVGISLFIFCVQKIHKTPVDCILAPESMLRLLSSFSIN